MDAEKAIKASSLDGGIEITGKPKRVAEFFEGLDAGISALKKQVPEEVQSIYSIYQAGVGNYFGDCPECSFSVPIGQRYCPNCGQRLGWDSWNIPSEIRN